MKKLTQLILLSSWLILPMTSCNNDTTTFDRPNITVPTGVSVQVSATTTLSFSVNAPGMIGTVSVTASSGTAEVTNATDVTGQTTATITVDYTAPATAGTETVTLTVSDQQNPAKSDDGVVTVTITEEPPTPTVDVYSSSDGVGTTTWTADNIYVLRGFVFVNDGQTLTIEPGTVVKGQPGQGAGASALIVARGGKIMAEGTADAPIIFTGLSDDLAGSVPYDVNSLWGGVIILGKAQNNNVSTGGVKNIEGIPTDETRGQYGGTDDTDNSGVLKYVSIRHGGSVIGADNEINGLSLGSVGSGTTIDHIEIISNFDDGIEFFGGDPRVTNVVITYPGDDGLDCDEGFHGSVQKGIVWDTSETLESSDPRGGEWDSGVGADEEAMPYAAQNIANITFVFDFDGTTTSNNAIVWRDNSAGSLYNSIVMGYSEALNLERRTDLHSSYDQWVAGTLIFKGNILYDINGVTDAANFNDMIILSDEPDATLLADVQADWSANNTFADPAFGTGADKFKPSASEVTANLATLPAGMDDLAYKGGVDPSASEPFFANWTLTWEILNN